MVAFICTDVAKIQKPISGKILSPGDMELLISSSLGKDRKMDCGNNALPKSPNFREGLRPTAVLNAAPNVTRVNDVAVLYEALCKPVVASIPDSTSGIRILRTLSDGAIGKMSLNAPKLVLRRDHLQMENIEEEVNSDGIHLLKRGRWEAPSPAKDGQSEKQRAFLKVPELSSGHSLLQSMSDLLQSRRVPETNGCDSGVERDVNGCSLSQRVKVLANFSRLPFEHGQILPSSYGKENDPSSVVTFEQLDGQKPVCYHQMSDALQGSNVALPQFSSFKFMPATKFLIGRPLSSNISNLANSPVSVSFHHALVQEKMDSSSSVIKSAVNQSPGITSSVSIGVQPFGFINSITKALPAANPKLIILRRVSSGGVETAKDQLQGSSSFRPAS